jgi:hypothetical protein
MDRKFAVPYDANEETRWFTGGLERSNVPVVPGAWSTRGGPHHTEQLYYEVLRRCDEFLTMAKAAADIPRRSTEERTLMECLIASITRLRNAYRALCHQNPHFVIEPRQTFLGGDLSARLLSATETLLGLLVNVWAGGRFSEVVAARNEQIVSDLDALARIVRARVTK